MVAGGAAFWSCSDCLTRTIEITFNTCEFSNNYGELLSGGISTHYVTFNGNDCLFNKQETNGYAGAIYSYGSIISIKNSMIKNTYTHLSAGIWLEHSYGTLINTQFLLNRAIYGHGGGLYISDIVELTITHDDIISDLIDN